MIALAAALIAAANGAGPDDVLMMPALIALMAILCLHKARQLDAGGEPVGSLVTTTAGVAIAMVLGSVSMFPSIDRWQNLAAIGREIHRDSDGHSLALLQPDETTLAMLGWLPLLHLIRATDTFRAGSASTPLTDGFW